MLVLHYHSPRSYHHSLPVFQTFWTGVNEGNDHAEYCSGLSHHRSVSFQLLCSALSPSKDPKEVTFAEKSGLCFIPLYSPARKPGIRTSNSSSVIFSRRDHSFSDTFWGGVWSSWWTIAVGTYVPSWVRLCLKANHSTLWAGVPSWLWWWVSQSTLWVCVLSWVCPRLWVNQSATWVCIPS